MKLEFKHILPYLLHDLKCLNAYGNIVKVNITNVINDYGDFIGLHSDANILLRPLSDLTKEIEVNGKKFVPTKHLEKLFLMEGLLEWKTTEYGWTGFTDNKNNNIPVYMDNTIIDECSLGVYNKLIKWHFDVFGLIEAGLAIDLNTVIPLTN